MAPHISTTGFEGRHSRSGSVATPRSPASPFHPLSASLSTIQSRYTLSNSRSLKAHNEACHDFPGGNTRTVLHSSPFPITFVKGKGCELTSLDNDIYIDFLGEFSAGIYGHSNSAIASAVSEAMESGWNYGGPNLYERELAKKVTNRFSLSGIELVRFTNSGTEANTMAIAAALAFTSRKKVIVFKNGYHGGTLSFPPTISTTNTNLPHDFIIAPYNDIPGTQSIISSLPKDSLAAIIVEPIQGSGGAIVGKTEFLQYLNTTAHKLGAVFIVDEVMTSRLAYHGYSAKLGLRPDLVTLGKWIGGGMTFGAFGGRKDTGIMSMFDPRSGVLGHSGTFNNNIVTMAAGCAGMDIYTEKQVQRLNALGELLRSSVESLLNRNSINRPAQIRSVSSSLNPEKKELESHTDTTSAPNLESLTITAKPGMWISGYGSLLAIHFSGENDKILQALFWHHMLEEGMYLAQRGFIALNIELREEHVEKFVKAVDGFISRFKEALT